MEQIEYFVNRIFGRLFDRARYAVTDTAETRIRDSVESQFERRSKADRKDP